MVLRRRGVNIPTSVADIRFLPQVRTNATDIRGLDTRVRNVEARTSQLETRIRATGGLNQSQVDARVTSQFRPLNTKIDRIDLDMKTRTGSNSAALVALNTRVTSEINARNRADGALGGQINQLQTNLTGLSNSIAGQTTLFNRINTRIIAIEAAALNTQNLIPGITGRLTSLEGRVGVSSLTGVRTKINNLSLGRGQIQTTFDVWGNSMAGARSGAPADATRAANHFTRAQADLRAWDDKPVVNVQRGIDGLEEVVNGVFDLGLAVVKLVNWASNVEASYRDLKTQAGVQSASMTQLRQQF